MTGDTRDRLAEDTARRFHEAYERLAPSFGYETRKASAVPWDEVPEPNRSLMVAVAGEVAAGFGDTAALTAEVERLKRIEAAALWAVASDDASRADHDSVANAMSAANGWQALRAAVYGEPTEVRSLAQLVNDAIPASTEAWEPYWRRVDEPDGWVLEVRGRALAERIAGYLAANGVVVARAALTGTPEGLRPDQERGA